MRALVVPVVIAVLVSLLVLVAAAVTSQEGMSVRGFFRDLRSGLSARFGSGRSSEDATAEMADLEPVDSSLDEFFAATSTDQQAYVGADGLANRLENVVDGVSHRVRR